MLELKGAIKSGRIQLNLQPATETPEQGRDYMLAKTFLSSLYQVYLYACFMKPLTSTIDITGGSVNEGRILEALRSFFEKHPVTPIQNFSLKISIELSVQYICTVGLVGAGRVNLLAESPDVFIAFSDDNGDMTVATVEIKKMASITTIENIRVSVVITARFRTYLTSGVRQLSTRRSMIRYPQLHNATMPSPCCTAW